jgi:uncharacterized paraquat-inducible protein A
MQTSRRKKWLIHSLAVLLCVALLAGDALACPTCKDGMSGGDPVSVARATGYFYSILFMMSMPFVIVGTFGGAAYLSIRRARTQQASSSSLECHSETSSMT